MSRQSSRLLSFLIAQQVMIEARFARALPVFLLPKHLQSLGVDLHPVVYPIFKFRKSVGRRP
jgi:hypothetical protein